MIQESTNIDSDVAISSRVRLARNLKSYPFEPRLSNVKAAELLERVKDAAFKSGDLAAKELLYIDIKMLSLVNKLSLVEKHLISPEFVEGNRSRAAIISKDERVSILINEEDHLRIQCIYPGMQIGEAWRLCSKLDTQLGEKLEFAYDKTFGYLTCCPTNIGTGIRASVMLHLPILTMTGYIKGILETCSKLGVAVRGVFGENSEASGNIFQISNQVTLGQTEEEIIAGVTNITSQIAGQERALRSEIYKQNPLKFEDRVFRSLGLLKSARIISADESIKLLSDVRLGIITGLISVMEIEDINKLLIMIQPAYLQKLAGKQMSPEERDQKRAELLRNKLTGKHNNKA